MENNDIIKQRQDRFKNLGIPLPIEKPSFDQPVTNVKDPKMLQRIQEIKNGAKKGEFNEILSVGSKKGFQALPEPKRTKTDKKNTNSDTKAPTLENFAPLSSSSNDLDIYEKMFSAEIPTTTINRGSGGPRIQEDINTDTTGSDFLTNFRQKLQAKALSNPSTTNNSGFGFKTQHETSKADLKEIESKIYEISSEVAKKIAQETIQQVLDQYLSKKSSLNENTFQKVKENIIKIGDKYYKITPVTIKQKN